MKKFLIIVGMVLLLLLIALITVPMIFKPQLEQLVKDQANKNLNASVDFEGIGLNLFQDFPNFTLNIKEPLLINKAPFEGDTLAQLSNFKIALDLKSLVLNRTVNVVSVQLDEPRIVLKVAPDGAANWDIVVPSVEEEPAEQPAEEPKEAAKFAILLQEYEIKDAIFSYADQQTGMSVLADQFNHKGSGNLTQDLFVLRTLTSIDELSFGDGTVNYLHKALLKLKADIDVDVKNQTYTVRENEFQIGPLLLAFDGFVKQVGEELNIDLQFKTNQNEFKDLLAMVPSVYQGDISGLESSGTIALEGKIQGIMNDPIYPAINIQMVVNDGMFRHPQAPVPLQNFNMALLVNSPGGPLDNTVIDLDKFHAEIGSEPVDISMHVKTPISDPHVQVNAKGNINLQNVNSLIDPQGSTQMRGSVSADLALEGRMSSIEKNAYDQFKANGDLRVKDFSYADPTLPEAITVSTADLNITQEQARLKTFAASMGKSDVQANGYLSNFIPFIMNKGVLKGNLNVSSNFIDLNPLMQGEAATTEKTDTPATDAALIAVPEGIEFTLNSAFKEVKLGKLSIKNAGGVVKLQDKKLQLNDLKMNLLEGTVVANGVYETPDPV
ncbi:AsmA family protein, partial [candidate division KSB1 bacterium]|nr:AsmA family protein [candidate division KSB1 bacterium]